MIDNAGWLSDDRPPPAAVAQAPADAFVRRPLPDSFVNPGSADDPTNRPAPKTPGPEKKAEAPPTPTAPARTRGWEWKEIPGAPGFFAWGYETGGVWYYDRSTVRFAFAR